MGNLTELELQCLNILATAFSAYQQLPELYPDDYNEFRLAIHTAQNIVLARPVLRSIAEG